MLLPTESPEPKLPASQLLFEAVLREDDNRLDVVCRPESNRLDESAEEPKSNGPTRAEIRPTRAEKRALMGGASRQPNSSALAGALAGVCLPDNSISIATPEQNMRREKNTFGQLKTTLI